MTENINYILLIVTVLAFLAALAMLVQSRMRPKVPTVVELAAVALDEALRACLEAEGARERAAADVRQWDAEIAMCKARIKRLRGGAK